jgi:IS30 family transposase
MCAYKQFSMYDRRNIEEGLNEKLSFRTIAKILTRSASSISREVKANRSQLKSRGKIAECSEKNFCKVHGLCDVCGQDNRLCLHCKEYDCRVLCDTYLQRVGCPTLSGGRFVCNGCKKRTWGCTRPLRFEYSASVADHSAKTRRSECRQGVDCTQEAFETTMEVVRPALARGLSPYEIATSFADKVKVSHSTLYRWIDAGYGGMANIELERKVGFAPRNKTGNRVITHHGQERSYEAFCSLDAKEREEAAEMDTVVGRTHDKKCLLTLYTRPSHFQFYYLLTEKTADAVVDAFDVLEDVLGLDLFCELFGLIITDNGVEFEHTERLEASHTVFGEKRCRVFYCDPRQSQQKPGCEKNHTELRQLLPKRSVRFDSLIGRDVSVVCSHVNSTPRKSLCGMSPIRMLKAAYGEKIDVLFDAYGIEEVAPDKLTLKPKLLNDERSNRGEEPLEF